MENDNSKDILLPELYFLIQKFLSTTPMVKTLETFLKEASEHKLLPSRLDWEGNSHERTFDELERLYSHISSDHLLQLCMRIESSLINKQSSIINKPTLLGHGLYIKPDKREICRRSFRDYAVRNNGRPTYDYIFRNHNLTNVIRGLEISGPLHRRYIVNPSFYKNCQLQRQTFGHLSAIYCLLYDHSGKYIITGADDLLVKLWSAINGKLIATFRGAAAEISDIAINIENNLLAAGSLDKVLRVWDLQTGAPVAVLVGHTGMITSVNFCPSSHLEIRYLISTSTDGSVAFWAYRYENKKVVFDPKPLLYQEKIRPGVSAQMICSSFSPGGLFLATGSADHHVRVYFMEGDEGPYRLLEVAAHTDRVDSIQWAHQGLRFLSGSKDGVANIWYFESQQWRNVQLAMITKMPGVDQKPEEAKKLKVTMVCWDSSDTWVITAVSDFTIKVWHSKTSKLEAVLKGHLDEVYVLEPHPKDASLFLSAGHDGQIFIWNILKKEHVFNFTNNIEGQGNGAIFDVKWSQDGNRFAASDSHGHISFFGIGKGSDQFEFLPKELFFHTDYRPLVRDANHVVLDEQTQVPPHIMPPPFLVDVEGNPYPPMLQRLVPGRENCRVEQLIPNIVVGMEGVQEIIEGLSDDQVADSVLAMNHEGGFPQNNVNNRFPSRVIIRRSGDIEGVRQSSGNWQTDPDTKWNKNTLVHPMKPSEIERLKEEVNRNAWYEMEEYRREMKKRPIMITTAPITSLVKDRRRKQRNNKTPSYLTRSSALSDDLNDDQDDAEESEPSSKESSIQDISDVASSDSSDSSGCSDWRDDNRSGSREPRKRSRRKTVQNKIRELNSDEEDEEIEEQVVEKPQPKPRLPPVDITKEIPEVYKPLEWLSQTIPKKAPYCPQIGDEVVYFKQGHLLYLEAVKTKKLYESNQKDLPWNKGELKDEEFVKIIELNYEIKPPRLCSLKLATLDNESRLTGRTFTVKYHDMADVLDFLVLKQYYDVAISRCWNLHDQFRCIIDDCWWVGEIISKSPVSELYPNSLFMCYEVKWENGEFERMSPWDLEPLCPERIPQDLSEAVPVLPEEFQLMLYQPSPEEWPCGSREDSCSAIVAGLEKIMELAIAEPFLTPVDLNTYPMYAYTIEYPIDFTTIRTRFENHYYRRIAAAQFDIRYIARNAEKFNEPTSIIVKHARILTELSLRVIRAGLEPVDINRIYHTLMDTYECGTDTEVEVELIDKPGSSTSQVEKPVVIQTRKEVSWKKLMKNLFGKLLKNQCSVPFCKPVDPKDHPDYYSVINKPMNMTIIRKHILAEEYETPLDFRDDFRLMIQNSKTYNTNKKSKIYAYTEELSLHFENQIEDIIKNWEASGGKETCTKKMNLRKRKNNNNPHENTTSDSSSSSGNSKKMKLNHNNVTANNVNNLVVNGSSSKVKVKALPPLRARTPKSSDDHVSTTSNSDDSDYQPLSELKQSNVKNTSNESESSASGSSASSSSSDSSSDEEYAEPTRTRNARVKNRRQRVMSSDSDEKQPNGRASGEDCVVSVSSRGRVRKLTSRVRDFLFK